MRTYQENNITPEAIKTSLSSVTTFFSLSYAIILTLSISYNVGYFKLINPQIVDLMGLVDYIEYTLHNVWFFLLAAFLFFCSSLGFIKKRIENKFGPIIVFGSFSLIISIYCFLKGIYNSKFWPTIKILADKPSNLLMFIAALFLFLILIGFIAYTFSFSLKQLNLPIYLVSVMSIVLFLTLVLLPYLAGMVEGYMEINYVANKDYKRQEVNITTLNTKEVLRDVFIIRKLDKGLILRQFAENQEHTTKSKIFLLLWGDIKQIEYKVLANNSPPASAIEKLIS